MSIEPYHHQHPCHIASVIYNCLEFNYSKEMCMFIRIQIDWWAPIVTEAIIYSISRLHPVTYRDKGIDLLFSKFKIDNDVKHARRRFSRSSGLFVCFVFSSAEPNQTNEIDNLTCMFWRSKIDWLAGIHRSQTDLHSKPLEFIPTKKCDRSGALVGLLGWFARWLCVCVCACVYLKMVLWTKVVNGITTHFGMLKQWTPK